MLSGPRCGDRQWLRPTCLVDNACTRKIETRGRCGDPVPMAEETIPAGLRRFILAMLPSVPHLEALLLVRDRPDGLGVDELAARLYVAPAAAGRLVGDLEQAGLLALDDGRVRFAPAREDLRAVVAEVAAVYARNVVAVSRLIHSTTDRKAFQFADAFRLRKEEDE